MKRIILSLLMAVSGLALAVDHPDHVKAEGHAVYKSGTKLEKKDVTLYVPKMGKGKVILELDGKEVESKTFFAGDFMGRKVFNVIFVGVPGAPKNLAVWFRGTYMRGDNLAVYYGDVYGKKVGRPHRMTCTGDSCDEDSTCDDDGCCEDCTCKDCKCCEGGTCDPGCDCCKGGCKDGSCKPGHGHPGRHHGGKHPHKPAPWTHLGGFGFSAKK